MGEGTEGGGGGGGPNAFFTVTTAGLRAKLGDVIRARGAVTYIIRPPRRTSSAPLIIHDPDPPPAAAVDRCADRRKGSFQRTCGFYREISFETSSVNLYVNSRTFYPEFSIDKRV